MISVIISVLNQSSELRRTLISLVPEKEGQEVIVVDGGSIDDSGAVAGNNPWAKLIRAAGTRGERLNAGAAAAQGEIYLFLDAGMVLERGWPAAVEEATEKEGFKAGCFRMRINGACITYRMVELETLLRTAFRKVAREQQAVFVRASDFPGGKVFEHMSAMETQSLCRRIGGQGKLVQLGLSAMSPATRWRRGGALDRCRKDALIHNRWERGAELDGLVHEFGDGRNAVMLFCSPPDTGNPKPWLADALGENRSADIYRSTVDQILATVDRARIEAACYVFYRPKSAQREMQQWLGGRVLLVPETGRTTGRRRQQAFDTVASQDFDNVLMLGTHCPAMNAEHLCDAIEALKSHDLVLGPTDDGGCYLVGVHKEADDLFRELAWSPDGLMNEMMELAARRNLTVAKLEPLRDFDSLEDLPYNWSMGFVQG